jgi:C-terminal region of Mon2 protein
MHLLKHLSALCSDNRPEVRHSANQTLFRTVGMNGQLLLLDAWDLCIQRVLLPLLEQIRESSRIVHQNTDTYQAMSPKLVPLGFKPASKSWDETKIITVAGVSKCLLDFMHVLVDLKQFKTYWKSFLDFMKITCLEGSSEVSVACLKHIRQVIQFSTSSSVINVKLQITVIWDVAWEVWESLGLEVISSSVSNAGLDRQEVLPPTPPTQSDNTGDSLIFGYFSQDALALYISVFTVTYPTIMPMFNDDMLRRALKVSRLVLLYHTIPAADATESRIKAEFVNDIDSLSPVQAQIFALVDGSIDFSNVQSSSQLILYFLSDLIVLPFATFDAGLEAPLSLKKNTYMALSKKAIQQTVAGLEREAVGMTVHPLVFSHILNSYRVLMGMKYRCPKPGLKNSTPLWKSAAIAAMTVIDIGLKAVATSNTAPSDQLDPVYSCLLDLLSDFLLSKSLPPIEISAEELTSDEDFDISFVTVIEKSIFIHFNQAQVVDRYIERLLMILVGCACLLTELDANPAQENSPQSVACLDEPSPTGLLPREIGHSAVADYQRDRFSLTCLKVMFTVCSEGALNMERIPKLAAPCLIKFCRKAVASYAKDRCAQGSFPMSRNSLINGRIRNTEILLILTMLHELNLPKGTFCSQPDLAIISHGTIREFLLSDTTAHLYLLFDELCELLSVLSGSRWTTLVGTDSSPRLDDEAKMVDMIKMCLKRIKSVFPIDWQSG